MVCIREGEIVNFEPNLLQSAVGQSSVVALDRYLKICPHCNKEMPASLVQQGGLHMECYGVEIDVWFVSLPDAPKCGFYEKDINQIANILKDAEDAYLIERQQMKAGVFYNLPEFEGF